MFRQYLPWVLALSVVAPSAASAQWGPQGRAEQPRVEPGYESGYQRGFEAGTGDVRRGTSFNFSIHMDFRRGDIGYRAQYGNRDRYRNEFRRAFEIGYQTGYNGARGSGSYGRGLPPNRPLPPRPVGRGVGRLDVATQQGYGDGYAAGLDDGEDRRRFDPIAERRYRSADHGYNARYGPRDYYKANYRNGFLSGYQAGYQDATRFARGW